VGVVLRLDYFFVTAAIITLLVDIIANAFCFINFIVIKLKIISRFKPVFRNHADIF